MCETGCVTVRLSLGKNNIILRVKDNGKGIPPDIIPKLMQRGSTFNKESGSGLGLYHARKTIEEWGGNIDIESEVGRGTSIIISLPRKESPKWFVPELNVSNKSVLVILDDDESIHLVWDARFHCLKPSNVNISLFHLSFYSPYSMI